jgi:hypothetical protein
MISSKERNKFVLAWQDTAVGELDQIRCVSVRVCLPVYVRCGSVI